jgi:uncharacterized lipoprotein YddW (UPF0748 family)
MQTKSKNVSISPIVTILLAMSILAYGCSGIVDESNSDTALESIDSPDGRAVEFADGRLELEEVQVETTDEPSPDTAPDSSGDSGDEQIASADEQIRLETRALWTKAKSKRDIDDLVAKIDSAHLNVIILLVYHKGTAYFEPNRTRFPDKQERLPNQSKFAEDSYRDALSYLLAIRDERRLDDDSTNDFEVHAWFTVMQNGDYDKSEARPRPDKTKPYMLHYLFPEFKSKYGEYYLQEDEQYINHKYSVVHQPKFRAYMTDLIAGLVEDYDVDGIHLDYIRAMHICYNNESLDYPGTAYDYPGCQKDYKAWTQATYGQAYTLWEDADGHKKIQDGGSGRVAAWQERAVGMLVKSIHDEVKSVKPDVIISAAVGMTSPDPEKRKASVQGQAAWEWLDQGWIDAAFVISHYADTQAVIDKNQKFVDASQNRTSRLKVFPGLAVYAIDNKEEEWSYLIEEQVKAVMHRQWNGQPLEPPAKGVALFVGEHLSEEAIEILADGPFKEPALPFWGEVESISRLSNLPEAKQ